MLKTFHEGKTDISMDTAFACSKEAQVSVLRVNVDMARNSFSKEIGAVLHFTDITAGYLVENVPQKIYQKNYENIIIIDANRKKDDKDRHFIFCFIRVPEKRRII